MSGFNKNSHNTTSGFTGAYCAASASTSATTRNITQQHSPTRALRSNQVTSMAVADWLINFCQHHGDLLTNLKLQKLLFYAQAWHLALNGKPLFQEDFQAWANGPIEPTTFAAFLHFGNGPVKPFSAVAFPKKQESHLLDLMLSYGSLSAFEMEQLSCDEQPWRDARRGLPPDEPSAAVITKDSLQKFYSTRTK